MSVKRSAPKAAAHAGPRAWQRVLVAAALGALAATAFGADGDAPAAATVPAAESPAGATAVATPPAPEAAGTAKAMLPSAQINARVDAHAGPGCPQATSVTARLTRSGQLAVVMPLLNAANAPARRTVCRTTIAIGRPAGWEYTLRQITLRLGAGGSAEATTIDASYYFQGRTDDARVALTDAGLRTPSTVSRSFAERWSGCDSDRALQLSVAVRGAGVTVRAPTTYGLAWRRCQP